jgi:hypothetical protein
LQGENHAFVIPGFCIQRIGLDVALKFRDGLIIPLLLCKSNALVVAVDPGWLSCCWSAKQSKQYYDGDKISFD